MKLPPPLRNFFPASLLPGEFPQTAAYPKSSHRTPEEEKTVRRLLRGNPDFDLIREATAHWPVSLFDYAIARVVWDTDPDRRAIVRRLLILRRTLSLDRIPGVAIPAGRPAATRPPAKPP